MTTIAAYWVDHAAVAAYADTVALARIARRDGLDALTPDQLYALWGREILLPGPAGERPERVAIARELERRGLPR
ncbi:MAG: hypothetical protein IT561_10950 [Alphaproteobacteria bacterium]|nr:hypothetical protein [Alphaproteobacteria bacterium]